MAANQEIELSNPLPTTRAPVGGAVAESDQARAIAEVQAQLIIAKRFPRNEVAAQDKITTSCQRKGLAESAMYTYARGGTEITGPSIRLAEVLASAWGNIQSGWRELSRSNGASEVEAYAWDLESNVRWSLTFQVKHIRDKRSGAVKLTDERDIYELCANQAARRLRACILKVIPGDIVDAAIATCDATLQSKANVTEEHVKRLVAAFAAIGVTTKMIEARIQRRLESITAPQVVSLGKIYNSLNDNMSKPGDWFDLALTESASAAPRTESAAPKESKPAPETKAADTKPPATKKPEPKKAPAKVEADADADPENELSDIPAHLRKKEDVTTGALSEEELGAEESALPAPRKQSAINFPE